MEYTYNLYAKHRDESRVYNINKENNILTIDSGISEELFPRSVSINIDELKPYIRYMVVKTNELNRFIVSNVDDTHMPYNGYFIDIYALRLLLTDSTRSFITIWKTEKNEVFILAAWCSISTNDFNIHYGEQKFSEYLTENSTDENCVTKWLESWEKLKDSINKRRKLMFRSLPVSDVEIDVLLTIIQQMLEINPELKTQLEEKIPDTMNHFKYMNDLNIYNIKSNDDLTKVLSDKERIRQIQNDYPNIPYVLE